MCVINGTCNVSDLIISNFSSSYHSVSRDKYQPPQLPLQQSHRYPSWKTSINQVGVRGKSIIYVRSGGEFRSFNSSMTFVSGLGRTCLYNAYWKNLYFLSLLPTFSFFLSSRYLIQRKVSQSKLPELFMTSVALCNSPSFKCESYDIYFYIITTLVIRLQHMRHFSSE